MSEQMEKIIEELPSTDNQPVVCSVVSRIAGEQLIGSVSKNIVWFLIEYTSIMEGKAFEKSLLPDSVKNYLSQQLKLIPDSRVQLIQQNTSFRRDGIHFFIAITSEANPALYEFHLGSFEDLLSIDIAAVLAEKSNHQKFLQDEPLILICTNGRRDPCCSRWGRPLFEEMSKAGNFIWQSSHVGGHRFAANVVCLPDGIYYGRVEKNEIESLIDACQNHRIYLPKYRGRACYSPEVQAADAFLRNETGVNQLEMVRFMASEHLTENSWDVRFISEEGQTYHVELHSEPSDFEVYESCKDQEPSVKNQFRLDKLE